MKVFDKSIGKAVMGRGTDKPALGTIKIQLHIFVAT